MISQLAMTYARREFIQQHATELLCLVIILTLPVCQWVISLQGASEPVFTVYWIAMVVSLVVSKAVSYYFVREARRSSTEVILNVVLLHLLPEIVHNLRALKSEVSHEGTPERIVTDKWDSVKGCLSSSRFRSITEVLELVEIYTCLKHLKQNALDQDSMLRLRRSMEELVKRSEERITRLGSPL